MAGFTMGGADLLHIASMENTGTLVGIAGRVHNFVSIAARRATSDSILHFSFSMRCWTLHPSFRSYLIGIMRWIEF